MMCLRTILKNVNSPLTTQRTGPKISSLYAFMSVDMLVMMVGPTKFPLGYFSTVGLRPSKYNYE